MERYSVTMEYESKEINTSVNFESDSLTEALSKAIAEMEKII